jgi:hypothetical protein
MGETGTFVRIAESLYRYPTTIIDLAPPKVGGNQTGVNLQTRELTVAKRTCGGQKSKRTKTDQDIRSCTLRESSKRTSRINPNWRTKPATGVEEYFHLLPLRKFREPFLWDTTVGRR